MVVLTELCPTKLGKILVFPGPFLNCVLEIQNKRVVTITGPPLKQIQIWSASYGFPTSISWQTLQLDADAEGSLKICAVGNENSGYRSIMAIFTTDKQLGIKEVWSPRYNPTYFHVTARLLNPTSSMVSFTSSLEINNDVIIYSSKSVKFWGKNFFLVSPQATA